MTFEYIQPPGEPTYKDLFMEALEKKLCELEEGGEINSAQADEKRQTAILIEAGSNPIQDAIRFARASILQEEEMIEDSKRILRGINDTAKSAK